MVGDAPIGWFKDGESLLLGSEIIYKALKKVQMIMDMLTTTYSRQKSYADNRRRYLEFEIGD